MVNKSDIVTRKILSTIRESIENSSNTKKILTEEDNMASSESFNITKSTPQFGDVRVSQEEALIKTIGERIEMGEDGLAYYSKTKDLVLTGKISSLNIAFQFKYNDPSGDGCYIWANALQLTEANNRTLGKIRDAFVNWKENLIMNGDLLDRLEKESKK